VGNPALLASATGGAVAITPAGVACEDSRNPKVAAIMPTEPRLISTGRRGRGLTSAAASPIRHGCGALRFLPG